MKRTLCSAGLLALALLLGACSLRRLALGGITGSLASSAETFQREDDPELAREALPFALKAIEGVLLGDPQDERLLVAASAGFALYAGGFLDADADALQDSDYPRALELRARALALFLRARDYSLQVLEQHHPGISERLRRSPAQAAAELGPSDLAAGFWTGATWGLAISAGKDHPELIADVEAVRELLRRALELDEDYLEGAVHQALISIEALPRSMGGSPERARAHFARAVELTHGAQAGPYVTLAESLSLPSQDRAEFQRLLEQALAVDLDAAPQARLPNRLAQKKARRLLSNIDELFLPAE